MNDYPKVNVGTKGHIDHGNSDDKRIYPCDDCGKMRSKNEGGTTFTVCDECWDKHFKDINEQK